MFGGCFVLYYIILYLIIMCIVLFRFQNCGQAGSFCLEVAVNSGLTISVRFFRLGSTTLRINAGDILFIIQRCRTMLHFLYWTFSLLDTKSSNRNYSWVLTRNWFLFDYNRIIFRAFWIIDITFSFLEKFSLVSQK